jgi:CubicO group peptidase (beta-lactamase class C family)
MSVRIITARTQGDSIVADDEAPVPWWSFTKTVLAAAVLVLVARDRLRLDDKVGSWPFTLRQLLQHRAGVPNYGQLPDYHAAVAGNEEPWPVEELLRRVDANTLMFEPGRGFAYSNIGYLWIRQMIENATDASLEVALQDLVFRPLGTGRAHIASVPGDLAGTAWGNRRRYHPGWVYHGLIVGPAADAALMLHRLLDGRLLSEDLLTAMRSPQPVCGPTSNRPWLSVGYGLGLGICRTNAPGEFIGHVGEGPGSVAAVYRFVPDEIDTAFEPGTAAVFAPIDALGKVEMRAINLASKNEE